MILSILQSLLRVGLSIIIDESLYEIEKGYKIVQLHLFAVVLMCVSAALVLASILGFLGTLYLGLVGSCEYFWPLFWPSLIALLLGILGQVLAWKWSNPFRILRMMRRHGKE